MLTRRRFLEASGLAAAYVTLPSLLGGGFEEIGLDPGLLGDSEVWAASAAAPNAAVLHLLNRITFGPRPGQVNAVAKQGIEAFLTQQLHPETIDDSAMRPRLAPYKSLAMTNGQLRAAYRDGGVADPWEISLEMQHAALLRAVYSRRQLFEVMVDFWTNHLNINIHKDECRWYKATDDRFVVRRYAFGKFSDMLRASAKSPAMLVYLDNQENIEPGKRHWMGAVNENYARELLELQTVGSDAGYTEADVRAVARVFTGWTLDRPWSDVPLERDRIGEFRFVPGLHDKQAKRIGFLNLDIPAGGGVEEGELVLARLARHPRTARRLG